jgi:endonuclease/exonuclease/phosphatase family metal-dependent hydrolase
MSRELCHKNQLLHSSRRVARCAIFTLLLLTPLSVALAQTPVLDSSDGDLVVVTLNIWHDQDRWPARLAVMLDTLRTLDPDVVFLQEVLQNDSLPNQAETLADSLGYTFVFVSVDPPGAPKRYGNAILTRHRIIETHEVKLKPLDDYRVAGHAHIDMDGRDLHAYVTHLHHTMEGAHIRAEQVQHLLTFIKETRGSGAILLGGDFNAAPDAPELRPILALMTDAYAAVHCDQVGVLVTTLNVAKGHTPRRIDYLFAELRELEPVASEVFLDSPTVEGLWASDHFGVWARFRRPE